MEQITIGRPQNYQFFFRLTKQNQSFTAPIEIKKQPVKTKVFQLAAIGALAEN